MLWRRRRDFGLFAKIYIFLRNSWAFLKSLGLTGLLMSLSSSLSRSLLLLVSKLDTEKFLWVAVVLLIIWKYCECISKGGFGSKGISNLIWWSLITSLMENVTVQTRCGPWIREDVLVMIVTVKARLKEVRTWVQWLWERELTDWGG